MSTTHLTKAAALMLLIVIASLTGWELYLRNQGIQVSYDNNAALWDDKRDMVYEPAEKATVFIGSSRIKYDLDIPTWEQLTGKHAVQLAYEGNNPVPALLDLSNDPNFKGDLIVDVTEGLFFSPLDGHNVGEINAAIKYHKDETPAQRAGFAVNHLLESQFVFLNKEDLSLPALLYKLNVPNRKGVLTMPFFPTEFNGVTFERQSFMMPRMLTDTNISKKVQGIWMFYGKLAEHEPLPTGDTLMKMIQVVKEATDKIKARGGRVLFVRTPSSGPYLMQENMAFPRAKYWDQLLAVTGCPGIHFADHDDMAHFECPEWSHLSPADAILFTKAFIKALQQQPGWAFGK